MKLWLLPLVLVATVLWSSTNTLASDFSGITIVVDNFVGAILSDESGRKTGITESGETYMSIPESSAEVVSPPLYVEPGQTPPKLPVKKEIMVTALEDKNYVLEITGPKLSQYNLEIYLQSQDADTVADQKFVEQLTSDQPDRYELIIDNSNAEIISLRNEANQARRQKDPTVIQEDPITVFDQKTLERSQKGWLGWWEQVLEWLGF